MHILYMIFIYPLESLMQFLLEWFHHITFNYGISIILLSITINILILPLYYLAEKWKAEDQTLREKMRPNIENIKKYYKNQERHFYIQTVYRQFGYHPLSSVKASLGLLIQIPFFFAAFHLLSNYSDLDGISFLGILKDLGAPDGLIGGVNALPIIMTIINLLSAYIYVELLNKSEKIQLLGLAFLFLVLLYNEPAGLLLYWTMNNVFSLVKNFLEKKFKFGPIFSKKFKGKKPSFEFLKKIPYWEILLLLLLTYIYFIGLKSVKTDGITHTFAIEMQQLLQNFFIYASILFLIIIAFKSFIMEYIFKIGILPFEENDKSNFILLLFPLMPIMQYVILNQNSLSIYGSIYLLIGALLASMILIISIPVLLSPILPKYLTTSLGIAFVFLVFYMPALALENTWHKIGNLEIQLFIFMTIFLIAVFLHIKNKKLLQRLILVLFFINTFYVVFTSSYDIEKNNVKTTTPEVPIYFINKIKNTPIFQKPNIYLLTYDSYVVNETMKQYGIDNSAQELFLEKNGFKIYRKAYSVAGNTLSTMGRVLNMSSNPPIQPLGGENLVYSTLQKIGYKVGIIVPHGPSYFGNKTPATDFYFPINSQNGYELIFNSIMEGEFRFDAEITYSDIRLKDFITEKRKFMGWTYNPQFIYTHTGPGHSQNSGQCLSNEKPRFKKRLEKANIEMKRDVEKIINNDPNAIIIVNGDHGPKLTGNCTILNNFKKKEEISRLDIQDRFGTFLAIRWPDTYKVYDENLTVLQDIFPAIFATLYRDKKIFNILKVNPLTANDQVHRTSGVGIDNGIIKGGINDGEPLFLNTKEDGK